MLKRRILLFVMYLGLLAAAACSDRDPSPNQPVIPGDPTDRGDTTENGDPIDDGDSPDTVVAPPILNPGRGQFRQIDILEFSRGLAWIPSGERIRVEEWLAHHVDVNEADLGIKTVNPRVKIFQYAYDMTAPVAQDYAVPRDEGAYLHFAETTVIQYRDLGGNNVGAPVTIPGSPAGGPATEASRIRVFMWDSERYACNVADPSFRTWQTNRILDNLGASYDGVFLDEHNPGFRRGLYLNQNTIISGGAVREFGGLRPSEENLPGKNYNELDSRYSAATADWLAALRASFAARGKFMFINSAQYYWIDLSESEYTAAGGVCLELVHVPYDWSASNYAGFAAQVKRAAASGAMVDLFGRWCEGPRATFNRGNYATSAERYRMWRLASYYYVRGFPDDPGIVYFNPSFCNENDTLEEFLAEWEPAYEVDIGDPVGDGFVIQQGTSTCGSYTVFAREYTSALVLVRPQDSGSCTEYGDVTTVTVPLPRPLRILAGDGRLGEAITSVQLRNAEAVVLVDPSGGISSVPRVRPEGD